MLLKYPVWFHWSGHFQWKTFLKWPWHLLPTNQSHLKKEEQEGDLNFCLHSVDENFYSGNTAHWKITAESIVDWLLWQTSTSFYNSLGENWNLATVLKLILWVPTSGQMTLVWRNRCNGHFENFFRWMWPLQCDQSRQVSRGLGQVSRGLGNNLTKGAKLGIWATFGARWPSCKLSHRLQYLK